ncbi:unnamed protein product [Mytilus edulis]|uniref:Uncharacterized protein n=1 Tax=Mytilus edulis TaxID=6550 RepID=A0A8S3V805_MYTED|nr:unnamed protein product [Mytilus edulis]
MPGPGSKREVEKSCLKAKLQASDVKTVHNKTGEEQHVKDIDDTSKKIILLHEDAPYFFGIDGAIYVGVLKKMFPDAGDEEDSCKQSGCVCETCPYKEELEKYKLKETLKTGGIIDAETAREKKMIELVPYSGVYIPLAVKTLIFEGSRSRSSLAPKLTRTLYTTEELKSFIKAADTIIPTIISSCLRYSGSKLKKSICNVVTYENRNYNQMMVKRKDKKKNRTNHLIQVTYMKWKKKQKIQPKKKQITLYTFIYTQSSIVVP